MQQSNLSETRSTLIIFKHRTTLTNFIRLSLYNKSTVINEVKIEVKNGTELATKRNIKRMMVISGVISNSVGHLAIRVKD